MDLSKKDKVINRIIAEIATQENIDPALVIECINHQFEYVAKIMRSVPGAPTVVSTLTMLFLGKGASK